MGNQSEKKPTNPPCRQLPIQTAEQNNKTDPTARIQRISFVIKRIMEKVTVITKRPNPREKNNKRSLLLNGKGFEIILYSLILAKFLL